MGQAQVRWCSSEQVTLCFNLLQFPTYFTILFLFLGQVLIPVPIQQTGSPASGVLQPQVGNTPRGQPHDRFNPQKSKERKSGRKYNE